MAILIDTSTLRALENYLMQLAANRWDAAKNIALKIEEIGEGKDTLAKRLTLNRQAYGYCEAGKAFQHAAEELGETLDCIEAMANDTDAEEVPE